LRRITRRTTATPCPYTTLFRSSGVRRGRPRLLPGRGRGRSTFLGLPRRTVRFRRGAALVPARVFPMSDADIPYAELQVTSNFSLDRKSTRLNSSHVKISYAVFC